MYGNRSDIYCLRFVYHELNGSYVTRLKIDIFFRKSFKENAHRRILLFKIYLLLIKVCYISQKNEEKNLHKFYIKGWVHTILIA